MVSRAALGAAVGLMLAGGAMAGPLEDGRDAIRRGDVATALALWQPLAEAGDGAAQLNLGLVFVRGDGVERDFRVAAGWFHKAALQGVADAQYSLGHIHRRGLGVPQDHTRALAWYRRAAAQGHAGAQLNIGVMYHAGWGVAADPVAAFAWFNLAAIHGDRRAAANAALVAPQLSADDKAEAERLAAEWQPDPLR